ncbi:MAG: prephenate dehydrogenase/arogenate dehydrogenase family protein [Acidiferrobacterales bacterium]|nr:prephenate dehydrogenase/arogenate dehydrogenase family protein [Acidiferrobacterales bacterium]
MFYLPKVALVGVGMIGGSLTLALKKRKLVGHVIGVGRSQANLENAMRCGAIDEIAGSASAAAQDADLIVLATPVGAMPSLMSQIDAVVKPDAVITDVGSVKHGVVAAARKALTKSLPQFVPAHPVAGKENSGVLAADADLYINHKVALTPINETSEFAVKMVSNLWRAVEAEIVFMQVEEHDRVLAMTSHLPHVLAYAMVHLFAGGGDTEKCYQMAGGGFYDFTRIASSDPVMWRDICKMNKQQLLQHIQSYQDTLGQIGTMIEQGNEDKLEQLFADARSARAIVTEKRKQPALDTDQVPRAMRVRQQVNR